VRLKNKSSAIWSTILLTIFMIVGSRFESQRRKNARGKRLGTWKRKAGPFRVQPLAPAGY
jgi:hypothetical protein